VVASVVAGCGASTNTAPPPEPKEETSRVSIADAGVVAPDGAVERVTEFPVDEMVSYFAMGEAAAAMDRYRRQEFDLADAAVKKALAASPAPSLRFALQVLQARILREMGDWEAAGALFAEVAEEPSDVSDYLHYEAALAFGKAGVEQAAKHAGLVATAGPWGQQMEFLLAEASRVKGDADGAAKRYRTFLNSEGEAAMHSEARYRLGEVLQSLGRDDEAREQWRTLLVSDPTSSWAGSARKRATKIDANLDTQELLTRGMAYFRANRNLESEKDLAAALAKSKSSKGKVANGTMTAEERCQALFHRAKSIYKERDYRKAAPKFVPAIAACKASGNTNYEVKAAYQAGLAYDRLRDYTRSAKHFLYVERYPEHSYADDARLRQAEQFASLKNDAKVTSLLSTIPKKYPNGDMKAEAMWRLGRRAYLRGEYEDAIGWLREQIRLVPIERNWWAEGQAHYWLGRSLAKHGSAAEASQAYQECIRRYPLTYYSLQAFARLKETWPDAYAASVQEIGAQASPWTGTFLASERYGTPEFRTALMLARLGIGPATRRQLNAIGMAVPDGRAEETDPVGIDRLVATSALLDLAGDYAHSHWMGRWHAVDYRRTWPTGANRGRWELAYPRAFWGLLKEFADGYTYPADLQMAIVREESAFDPNRESWANAIGLTQMIFPTAIDHSKESGIRVTRENLQHPVKNVTIGSHFLQSLQQGFDGRVGLMVPGYNAGRARVRGWIRQRSKYDLDEFIELIPGDQARRYTKRVLGSYFTYAYLGDGHVPEIRNAVPRKLGRL